MRSVFQMDSCYELTIVEDCPRAFGDPRNVTISVTHTPLSLPSEPSGAAEHVVTFNLKPSHARAVASALLAAATEARS